MAILNVARSRKPPSAEEMKEPDLISFNSSIQAASLCWPMALQLFGKLQEADLQPDTVTFNAVLNATAPESVMEEIFQKAVDSKAYPWFLGVLRSKIGPKLMLKI